MKKQIQINVPLLILIVLLCLFAGGMFGRKTVVQSDFKHRYDSLESVVKTERQVLTQTASSRDSARTEAVKIKSSFDSLERVRKQDLKAYERDREESHERWEKMSDDELAKEANHVYEQAHPTPLFDN